MWHGARRAASGVADDVELGVQPELRSLAHVPLERVAKDGIARMLRTELTFTAHLPVSL
jgi:hypothetical protein